MPVYCSDCDGEWSVYDSIEDHDQYEDDGVDHEIHAAELVVSLGGHRGHYLARDFIEEAISLVPVSDGYRAAIAPEVVAADATYADLNEYDPNLASLSDVYECCYERPGRFLAAGGDEYEYEYVPQLIHEAADEVESLLVDAGYVVEWNDGVMVYKVGEKLR